MTASLVFALFSAEAIVRSWQRAPPFDAELRMPPYLGEEESSLRWRFPAAADRNSLGLRNREVEEKGEGARRVLFLGDSLVWAGETTSGPLYTELLEEEWTRRLRGEAKVEVVNAGVPGYTTYQELELLRLHGLAMDPDLVLLAFVLNDLHDPYLSRPTESYILALEPEARLRRFDSEGLLGALFARSYLAHELVARSRRVARRLGNEPLLPEASNVDFYLAWRPHAWPRTEGRLRELRALLASRSIPLGLVLFPLRDQVDAAFESLNREYVLYPQRRLAKICGRLRIPCLDLHPALAAGGGAALYRDGLHLAPAGNDLVAAEVSGWVRAVPELWRTLRRAVK